MDPTLPLPELPPRYELTPDPVIGQGGFGIVYRARDVETGELVAVKVPYRAAHGDVALEVATELKAAARVRHPAVIGVLDAGTDAVGNAFLVLEFADGGSLQSMVRDGPPPWSELCELLDSLLSGLGHLHALGLVHRDVKADNVLLATDRDGQAQPKLSDFGLARVRERHGQFQSTRVGAGTPAYMAPELFDTDLAAVHAPADLYAFGVLVYFLVCGVAPWTQRDWALVYAKQINDPRPLQPRAGYEVPAGLEQIVARLLARRPADRYRLAAEVRADLRDLAGGAALRPAPIPSRAPSATDSTMLGLRHRLPEHPPPPPAPDGRPPTRALVGVREPSLFGRTRELQILWQAARQATVGPKAVALVGARGIGRSRLCQWLTRTLEEAGAATTLHVRIERGASPVGALDLAFRQFTGVSRLHGEALVDSLSAWMTASGAAADEAEGLAREWAIGRPTHPGSTLDLAEGARVRLSLVDRALRLEARRGLVCLWVEEAGREVRGTDLVDELLRSALARRYPLLVLHELPGGVENESGDTVERLTVNALEDRDAALLLDDLLPDGLPVDSLVASARGVPMVLVETARLVAAIGDQRVAGDVLERLRPTGAVAIVPPASGAVVPPTRVPVPRIAAARIDAFEGQGPEAERRERLVVLLILLPRPCPRALLLAASERWAPGTEGETLRALDEARDAGIAGFDRGGSIVLAVDPAEDRVDLRTDAAAVRRACAEVLLGDAAPSDLAARSRAGVLLFEAGEPSEALPLLNDCAEAWLGSDTVQARALFDTARRAASAASLPFGDPESVRATLGSARAARDAGEPDEAAAVLEILEGASLSPNDRGWHLETRATVHIARGHPDDALRDARAAEVEFQRGGDAAGRVHVGLLAAEALYTAGRLTEAVGAFEEAGEGARQTGQRRIELDAGWRRARVLRSLGRTEEAEREFQAALVGARDLRVRMVEGVVLRELGNLALLAGRHDEAERRLREAIDCLERGGYRADVATCRLSIGELLRARGDLAGARKEYSGALGVAQAYGARGDTLVALLNLAMTELALGRVSSARRRLLGVDEQLPPASAHRLRPYIELIRMTLAAEAADWPAAEDVLDRLSALPEALPPDPDILGLLERTAELAQGAGETTLAVDGYGLALTLAGRIGDTDAQARLQEKSSRA